MEKRFILSIDHGTTGSRVFCFDEKGHILSSAYREFAQHFPRAGWVEHDAEEIWAGIRFLIHEAMERGDLDARNALGIGITNQRETVVVWEKSTGKPVHHAIVWQCRRTADICEGIRKAGHEETIRAKTGLVVDAYFSGTKLQWILDHVPSARTLADRGRLAAGTMDTWLLYKLTGEHKTDYTNASRTMLFNIRTRSWDEELLSILKVPGSILPEAAPSQHRFGVTKGTGVLPDGIPVLAMAGDQQSALFGQLCTEPGQAKNTYGTGCFLLFHTGNDCVMSHSGLVTTLACDQTGGPAFALEGSVFIGGAVIQWLRDYMKFFATARETQQIVEDISHEEDDLVFVPAFVGLGAPHWDMKARGSIFGITRDTSPARITRAALKSIALQSHDLVKAMEQDTGNALPFLRADGGASANNFLMQFQADILGRPVERPANIDTTASGVAFLAGIGAGIWRDANELRSIVQDQSTFQPGMAEERRQRELRLWHRGVERSRNWVD